MTDFRRLRSRIKRHATHACIILGVLAIVTAAISPAAVRYGTLRFDRMTREVRIETRPWVRNPMYHPPTPTVEEDTTDTNLLRLKRRWIFVYRIEPSVLMPEYRGGSGSAIATRGTQALIANRFGQFYEVDLDAPAGSVRRLPLKLATNYDALRTFVGRARPEGDRHDDPYGNKYGGVTDLLFLNERQELAAAYTYFDPQTQSVTMRVAVVSLTSDWRSDHGRWRVVFESEPAISLLADHDFRGNQAGGRLVAIDAHRLYLAVGDFAYDGVVHERIFPPDPAASYGKVIEINLDTLDHGLIASGLRNPQGLMRDHEGRIWSTEHGPRGGDKLNLIRPGRDYGWPYVTLGTDYGTHSWPLARQQGRHSGYEPPVYAWIPSIGVSNLIQLQNFAPEWDGDLLVLSLVGRRLSRLRMNGGSVVYEEQIQMGGSLRDVEQLADGRVVLWTDDARIAVVSVDREPSVLEQLLNRSPYGVRSIVRSCAECHTLATEESDTNRISLRGVYGRRFATGAPIGLYSEALRQAAGKWNDETLNAFLRDPQAAVPGTTMQIEGIRDDTLRAQTIDLLKSLR
jgi:glucose/arabinose dehydrogenase